MTAMAAYAPACAALVTRITDIAGVLIGLSLATRIPGAPEP